MVDVAEEQKSKAQYLADLAGLPANGHPVWLREIRNLGADLFRETPYPHTKMEEWRQTNIAPIVNAPFRSLVAPRPHHLDPAQVAPFLYGGGAWTELVFVDGYFAADLSCRPDLPGQTYAGGLAAALDGPQAALLKPHLNAYLRGRNAYTALNTAFLQDGAFVYVPRNTALEQPIHLVFLAVRAEPELAAHIRSLMVLDESAEASVVVSFVHLADKTAYFNNVVEEISLGCNAHLRYAKIVAEGAAGEHLATTEIRQQRDSRLTGFVCNVSGHIARNQICVELDGEGASCTLNGLCLNDGERLTDNALSIIHAKPQGASRIHWKGILDDTSKAVFTGKVYVCPDAQQTDSNQLNHNLLLSDRATIDTKPQLEIYADDVKCTHGAAVGPAPEEVIFYFQSRGIDEPTARGMLTCGFAGEILDKLDVKPVRDRLHHHVLAKYGAGCIGPSTVVPSTAGVRREDG
jgi:Fe-S cluster assembly protein SufD